MTAGEQERQQRSGNDSRRAGTTAGERERQQRSGDDSERIKLNFL